MKLFYYEVITKYSSGGFFSGYVIETSFGLFDYWTEGDNVIFYNSRQSFIKEMETIEGSENFVMVKV